MSVPQDELWAFETRPIDEERWSTREDLFKARGYNFRPRLRKGWTPSWRTTGKSPLHSEDGEILRSHLVDAYTDDDKLVCIKRIVRNSEEARIMQLLNTPELREDPRNHAVPLIEIFDDPDNETMSYMVMPLLRNADNPSFQYVKEIIDFVDQILEGLVFLHEKRVAHRDCVLHNILMDPGAMYPEGFHPVETAYKRDYSGIAVYLPRSAVGVKYYIADFGISSYIPDETRPPLVYGTSGRDQEAPELSKTVPYNPFMLDIFIIGNMFREKFCDKFTNAEFLRPLADYMTSIDPGTRPSAEEALLMWRELREEVFTVNKEWRPRPRGEDILGIAWDMISMYNVTMYFGRSIFGRLYSLWSHSPL